MKKTEFQQNEKTGEWRVKITENGKETIITERKEVEAELKKIGPFAHLQLK